MTAARSIYFNPGGDGLEIFLGPTEARAMEIIWREGAGTVKKVLFHWPETKRPAYNTVLTILTKLTEKGLLARTREGRHFVYDAAQTRDDFVKSQLELVAGALKRNFPEDIRKILA